MQNFPIDQLKTWFLQERRSLPWREDPTPYRVWISEVMLQQTQVAVVIPYFERWMETFPTIDALSAAPIEKVLKCWEGLGYYSRARNLHKAAQFLVQNHQGQMPASEQQLRDIVGIGTYTQGAIRSFAFKQKAAAVDGNVLRVLSRFLAFEEEIDSPRSQKFLQAYAESILPNEEPWLVSEGLIELGATVCSRNPQCILCPLRGQCLAFRQGLQKTLPKKKPRQETVLLKRIVAVVHHQGHYLLQRGKEGKVMADLYEFPYLEWQEGKIDALFSQCLGLTLKYIGPLPIQKHTFTRFKAELYPHLLEAEIKNENFRSKKEIRELPFSSGHKKILQHL